MSRYRDRTPEILPTIGVKWYSKTRTEPTTVVVGSVDNEKLKFCPKTKEESIYIMHT